MLPDAAPQDAFERLRALPFVEFGTDGLVIHDTVRDVVATILRSLDPDRSRAYRIAAWRQLRNEVARASQHEMWRYTADLLFILENPLLREAFFPTTEHLYYVEGAEPADGPAIDAIVERNEPPASLAILREWWRRAPHAFRVVRDGARTVVGCSIVASMDRVPQRLLEADPVARRWLDHLRRYPVPHGQRILFDRIELAPAEDSAQSAVLAAILLDLKSMYMELRPDLRRIYNADRAYVAPGSVWSRVEITPIPGDPPMLDGIAYYPAVLDFGPASVDGWLTRIIARELRIEDGLDRRRRPAPARPGRPANRPHQARVRGVQLPLRTPRQDRVAIHVAPQRLGLRRRGRQQRRADAHGLASTKARGPRRNDRDGPGPRLQVRAGTPDGHAAYAAGGTLRGSRGPIAVTSAVATPAECPAPGRGSDVPEGRERRPLPARRRRRRDNSHRATPQARCPRGRRGYLMRRRCSQRNAWRNSIRFPNGSAA